VEGRIRGSLLHPEVQLAAWALIAAAVIVVICFANSIPNDFVLDDYKIVALNPAIRTIAPLQALKSPYWGEKSHAGIYRPLTIISFSLEYPLWKRWPGGYRITNLLLHAINGFLVFLLTWRLLQSQTAAWAASAVYLAHPVHTEPVVSLVGRAELLAAMFFLLAWLLFRQRWTGLSVVAFCFSLLSKENAIVFPAVIVLDIWMIQGGFKRVLLDWRRFIAVVVPAALYLMVRIYVLGSLGIPKTSQYLQGAWTTGERVLTSGKAFLKYFQLLVAPVGITGDYDFNSIPIGHSRDWIAWIGLLLVVLGIIAGLRLVKTQPAIGFGILFFYVTILPVSNWIMPQAIIMSERSLYLPSVGICLIAGLIWTWLPSVPMRRAVAIGVMSTAALLCIADTYIWRNDLTYFGNLVRVFPNNVRGQQGYGTALVEAGRPAEAQEHFEAGLRISRGAPLLVGLSQALLQIDRGCSRARPTLQEALTVDPGDPFAPWLMATCLENEGSLEQAEAMYRQAVHNTSFPEPRLLADWGRTLEKTGRREEAQEAYRRAALVR
jgi:hypothetical protein